MKENRKIRKVLMGEDSKRQISSEICLPPTLSDLQIDEITLQDKKGGE
jgi:hypothetical protein